MGIARKPVFDVKARVAVQVCIGDGLKYPGHQFVPEGGNGVPTRDSIVGGLDSGGSKTGDRRGVERP